MAKFGRIKRQHGRVDGLDDLLNKLIRECPHITRIVPGRMGRKRGNTPQRLKIQYATGASDSPGNGTTGLKCIYTKAGSWQEVFLICDDADAAQVWLEKQPFVS